MRKALLAAVAVLALALGPIGGSKAQNIPSFGGTPISASSGNVANAAAVATIPAVAGKTAYLCGFSLTSSGSTGAAVVAPTVVGLLGGTQTFAYATVAGATLGNPSLVIQLGACVPASAVNVAIVVTLPALGAGNTNASANAWGYYL